MLIVAQLSFARRIYAVSPTPPKKTRLNIFAILPFRPNRMVQPLVSCVYTTEEERIYD